MSRPILTARRGTAVRMLPLLACIALLCVLSICAVGVCLDFATAIASPLELDYGEGIVWQQAALIPGPAMYGTSPDLPFIVFHYPPLYYLLSRAMLAVTGDFLAAGRAVSAISTLLIAACVSGLVLAATDRPGGVRSRTRVALAAAAGLLLLSLHVAHIWGMVMRVDAAAIALAMAGLLVGARTDGRLAGTTLGFLLCAAAVFTKQTQVSAGLALLVVGVCRSPRRTAIAALIVGTASGAALWLLQARTGGGFLHNVVGDNINRFSLQTFRDIFWGERSSAPVMAVMLVAAAALWAPWRHWRPPIATRGDACRVMLLLYFGFTTLTLATTFKSGGNFNYLFEWLAAGCGLIGVLLVDTVHGGTGARLGFLAMVLVLIAGTVVLPFRETAGLLDPAALQRQAALVRRIAAAPGPVSSENMTLLMQAGKRVIYEPAIVTELAELGHWNEAPLVAMIRAGGFAFMITSDDQRTPQSRRTPAVDAAMRAAYPRTERLGLGLWINQKP